MTASRTTQLTETAKDLGEQAADRLAVGVEAVKPHIATAADRLAEGVEAAKPHLSTAFDNAKVIAAEASEQAKQRAMPLVGTGAAYAAEKANEVRQRALEATDEVTGKAKRRKRRRAKIFSFIGLGLLAAVAGVIAKKALGTNDRWEDRVTPTAPEPVPDTAPPSVPTPGVARTNATDAHVGESAEDLAGEALDDDQRG